MYITIGSSVLITIIIIFSICFVFRKRLFKKITQDRYKEPTVLWNGNAKIEISSVPIEAGAELSDHIYESLPDLGYTTEYDHLDYNQQKPISTNNHYANHLILKRRRQNSM